MLDGSVAAVATSPMEGAIRAILVDACREYQTGHPDAPRWHLLDEPPSARWIKARRDDARPPAQGWKIHVSAGAPDAKAILRRVLPVLLAQPVTFKVAATLATLNEINGGRGGHSQVGKFITVYPNDDDQAVRLAAALDRATAGLRGPAIPSDRPLRPGSLVHYRYGAFDGRRMQTPLGEYVYAVNTPDGELVPDRRSGSYRVPDWATDPFEGAGIVTKPPVGGALVADRYLTLATLYASPRGSVHLAVDVEAGRRCVLKRGRRDAQIERDGRDARDRLRHEFAVLRRLAPDPRFPIAYDLVDAGGDLCLAMEDVEGTTLEAHVAGLRARGCFVPGEQVVAWGRELAGALSAIRAAGFVYHDLKTPNVIVAPDGSIRLVDLEFAYPIGGTPRHPSGTRGYMPPARDGDQGPAGTDDVYGLGALLYFAATGAEPSHAPRPHALLERPIALLNPAIGPALTTVVARCLDPDPARRFAGPEAVAAALAAIGGDASVMPPAFGAEPSAVTEAEARRRSGELARRLGDTLCAAAVAAPEGRGLAWVSAHPVSPGVVSRDLNTGGSGAILALAELVAAYGAARHRAVLEAATDWVRSAPRPGGEPLPGLYVGEAAGAVALLRAGQVLARPDLIAAAAARARGVAALPFRSPDLFNGTAGRLRAHLLIWDETGAADDLAAAQAAGEALLAAEDAADGGGRWTIPPGYDGLSGRAYLGYAHGSAGIADALLDLWEATGDDRFLPPVMRAGRRLAALAVPTLADGSGLNWPPEEGKEPGPAFWCHGAAGVARFFLHAAALDLLPEAADLAARGVKTVARATRWSGPTQCHGLAGSIEVLLDVYQATRNPAYPAEARSQARLLEAFASDDDGLLRWPADSPAIISPDYMVGYAGVAVCLLRLADPERRPHQLSRAGFRYRPSPEAGTGPAGDGIEIGRVLVGSAGQGGFR